MEFKYVNQITSLIDEVIREENGNMEKAVITNKTTKVIKIIPIIGNVFTMAIPIIRGIIIAYKICGM